MIIRCDNCNKKFEINQNLIPSEGRMLQCGSCNNKWFFKLEKQNDVKKTEKIILKEESVNTQSLEENKESYIEKKEIIKNITKKKYNINYFKIFLAAIISLIAFIIILETFKEEFIIVFPNIKFLLNNLYQSIEDIKLFILDLIK